VTDFYFKPDIRKKTPTSIRLRIASKVSGSVRVSLPDLLCMEDSLIATSRKYEIKTIHSREDFDVEFYTMKNTTGDYFTSSIHCFEVMNPALMTDQVTVDVMVFDSVGDLIEVVNSPPVIYINQQVA
jgi:hypothetical protein